MTIEQGNVDVNHQRFGVTEITPKTLAPDSRKPIKVYIMAKQNGRPITAVEDRLCCSIKVRLNINDYCDLLSKSEKLGITLSAYAREMISKGVVKAPYSDEELDLMRKLVGEANNLNQIAKHLNSGAMQYRLQACAAIVKIKNIIDDSKKY